METLATQGVRAITTRDLSKNPSKALRDASAQPLIVMRHQRPIACLVSIEQWAELVIRLKDIEMNSSVDQIDMQIRRLDLENSAHFAPAFPAPMVSETNGK